MPITDAPTSSQSSMAGPANYELRDLALVDDPFGFRSNFLRSTLLQIGGLSGKGRFEPGEQIDALQPLPTWLISIRYSLYSMGVTLKGCRAGRSRPG
jgi:hypothetical protein